MKLPNIFSPLHWRRPVMSDFPHVLPPCPKECLVLYNNKEQEQWTSTYRVSNNRHLRFVSLFSFFSSFLKKIYYNVVHGAEQFLQWEYDAKEERERKKKSVFWCFFWSLFQYSGHIWQKLGIVFKLSKNGKEYSKVVRINALLRKETGKVDFLMTCF